jgi:hypothetical protein
MPETSIEKLCAKSCRECSLRKRRMEIANNFRFRPRKHLIE